MNSLRNRDYSFYYNFSHFAWTRANPHEEYYYFQIVNSKGEEEQRKLLRKTYNSTPDIRVYTWRQVYYYLKSELVN